GEVVEHVVADHDVVADAVVDPVIVVLPVAVRLHAPLLARPQAADVVDDVALDGEIIRIGVHAHDPTHAAGADVPDVVDMVLQNVDVVVAGGALRAPVGVEAVAVRVADFEALDADVIPVDLEAGGGTVVLPVDRGAPQVRGAEHEPARGRAAAADGHDVGTPGVHSIIDDHGVPGVRHVGRVLDGAPGSRARPRIRVVAGRGIDVVAYADATPGRRRSDRDGGRAVLPLARRGGRRGAGRLRGNQPVAAHTRHAAVAARPRDNATRQRVTGRVLGRRGQLHRLAHLHARRRRSDRHRGYRDGCDTDRRRPALALARGRDGRGPGRDCRHDATAADSRDRGVAARPRHGAP